MHGPELGLTEDINSKVCKASFQITIKEMYLFKTVTYKSFKTEPRMMMSCEGSGERWGLSVDAFIIN